jgi:multicomponent Na+:H+ antiporter subunit F
MTPIQTVSLVALSILSLALVLASYRLLRGPSLPDRVIALDLIAMVVVSIIGVYCIFTGVWYFLDIALVLALLAFLGTVAFARYLELRH